MSDPLSRRQFLRLAAGGVLGVGSLGIGSAAYITRIEPYRLDITRVTVPLAHLPAAFEGFTIAHLSDFHIGDWITMDHLRLMVDRVNALAPDLVAEVNDLKAKIDAFIRIRWKQVTTRRKNQKKRKLKLTLKFVPELRFQLDETFDRMDETRRLFAQDEVRRDIEE